MIDSLFPIVTDTAKPVGTAVGATIADVWQGIVGDRISAWRISNAVQINEKLRTKLAASGVKLRRDSLPPGVAFRWFEEATQADEPEIQELFAQLLANAATGNADALRKRNIELVSRLSPEDAQFLSYLAERFESYQKDPRRQHEQFKLNVNFQFHNDYKKAGFDTQLPIDNLLSLGILRHNRDFQLDEDMLGQVINRAGSEQMRGVYMGLPTLVSVDEALALTEVGRSLIQALFTYK